MGFQDFDENRKGGSGFLIHGRSPSVLGSFVTALRLFNAQIISIYQLLINPSASLRDSEGFSHVIKEWRDPHDVKAL